MIAEAVDSLGFNISETVTIVVNAAPATSTPLASQTSADVGQTVSFETWATEGTLPYLGYAWSGLLGRCTGADTTLVTCQFETPGVRSITVTVNDSAGGTSGASLALVFDVYGEPALGAPMSNRPSVDFGQPASFAASASNGSGEYSYVWSGLPEGCGGTGPEVSCIPTTTGTYSIGAQVEDSNGITSKASGRLIFSVEADPTVRLSASRIAVDLGQAFRFDAEVSNGSGGYGPAGSSSPGCSGVGQAIDCLPTSAGLYEVTVIVNDSNGGSATSNAVVVAVEAPLSVKVAVVAEGTNLGSNWTFDAVASGGLEPVVFAWQFGDGTNGTGEAVTHPYRSEGRYLVTVRANDSSGSSATQTYAINVSGPTPAKSSTGSSSFGPTILFGVCLGILAVAAILFVWGRRVRPDGSGVGSDSAEVHPGGSSSTGQEADAASPSPPAQS